MQLFPNYKRVAQMATLSMVLVAASLAFGATTRSDIDQMSGWQSCSVCAGAGGSGPSMSHYMKQNIASPSMDGRAAQFSISGGRYANALWWKQLGANDAASNFVYDPYNRKWRSTSIACSVPKAYTWHHVVLEFKRSPSVGFVSVTINGHKYYFNRSYAPRASGAREVNVAFQMDSNGSGTPYTVWVDKVKLTYW